MLLKILVPILGGAVAAAAVGAAKKGIEMHKEKTAAKSGKPIEIEVEAEHVRDAINEEK